MTTTERNKLVKKALSERFGAKNVSVRGGRGTAYGWIEVTILSDAIEEAIKQGLENGDSIETIKETLKSDVLKISDEARDIIHKTGVEIYTFTSDDGYNSEHECLLINVRFTK